MNDQRASGFIVRRPVPNKARPSPKSRPVNLDTRIFHDMNNFHSGHPWLQPIGPAATLVGKDLGS